MTHFLKYFYIVGSPAFEHESSHEILSPYFFWVGWSHRVKNVPQRFFSSTHWQLNCKDKLSAIIYDIRKKFPHNITSFIANLKSLVTTVNLKLKSKFFFFMNYPYRETLLKLNQLIKFFSLAIYRHEILLLRFVNGIMLHLMASKFYVLNYSFFF